MFLFETYSGVQFLINCIFYYSLSISPSVTNQTFDYLNSIKPNQTQLCDWVWLSNAMEISIKI